MTSDLALIRRPTGNIAALSLISIPAITDSETSADLTSQTLARQWRTIYNLGKAQNPPIALVTASSLLYTASAVAMVGKSPHLIRGALPLTIGAAIATLGIIPWTLITLAETNTKLWARADGKKTDDETEPLAKPDKEETLELISHWGTLNTARSMFPLAGAVLGMAVAFV
jgi:hypothetical protein